MYSYTPKPDRRLAAVLICLCFSVATVFTVVGAVVPDISYGLVGALDLLLLFVALVLSTRYMRTNYAYSLLSASDDSDGSGGIDFVVVELGGRNKKSGGTVVCRISVRDITGLYTYSRAKEKELKKAARRGADAEYSAFMREKEKNAERLSGVKLFNYSPELLPTKYSVMYISVSEEASDIESNPPRTAVQALKFMPDSMLHDLILRYANL